MKKFVFAITAISIALAGNVANANEPTNISVIKDKLVKYHDSGEYARDIKSVITNAMNYLKDRVSRHENKKLAIVLDIDETSLSNYDDMHNLNFGGTLDEIQLAEDKGLDPAIKPTLELYKYAKAHDVAVFFITGRSEDERTITAQNLRKEGYNNWDGLILRDGEYLKSTAKKYKVAMRRNLTKKGYDIVLNIGDQRSDLAGGFSDKAYKLPNPYYFIP